MRSIVCDADFCLRSGDEEMRLLCAPEVSSRGFFLGISWSSFGASFLFLSNEASNDALHDTNEEESID